MRVYGVTLDLVPPVKPDFTYPVSPEKADISLQCLCTFISSGAVDSDLVIMFGPLKKIMSW